MLMIQSNLRWEKTQTFSFILQKCREGNRSCILIFFILFFHHLEFYIREVIAIFFLFMGSIQKYKLLWMMRHHTYTYKHTNTQTQTKQQVSLKENITVKLWIFQHWLLMLKEEGRYITAFLHWIHKINCTSLPCLV